TTPTINFDEKDEEASFKIKNANRVWSWLQEPSQSWNLAFPTDIPVEFLIDTGASTNDLDFSELHVTKLTLDIGASTTIVTFGSISPEITAKINTGAATLTIRLPEGMAVRLHADTGMSTLNLPNDLEKKGDERYESSTFSSAATTIDITLDSGVSTITLEYYTPSEASETVTEITYDSLRSGSQSPYPYDGREAHLIIMNSIDSSDTPEPVINLYESSLYKDHLVMLLLQGQKPTGGYRIRTKSITLTQNIITINAELLEPTRDDLVTQALTNPYELISIPKKDVPLADQLVIVLRDTVGNELQTVTYLESGF
ncbi:MAG TPA: protease complex subunit PrcB family protein, partial [bacterium]|nr:protease complex subunit PrcB family protein [bacterium]